MGLRVPITIRGTVATEPEHATGEGGLEYTRFSVAVSSRRFNDITRHWEDARTAHHRVVVYCSQGRRIAENLRVGDSVLIAGDLQLGDHPDVGNEREGSYVVADIVAASPPVASADGEQTPGASGPGMHACGSWRRR